MRLPIRKNEHGEYEVPTERTDYKWQSIYYTDDKQDAIDTALLVWKDKGLTKEGIYIRTGSYNEE